MKLLISIGLLILMVSSCTDPGNEDIICTFNDHVITIRNADATLEIDNDICFEIFFSKNGKLLPLTEDKANPSILLFDSTSKKIQFVNSTGGGIPLVDIWNKEFGLALTCLADKPCDVSLPVKVENGKVNLGITLNYKNQILTPGDNLVSLQTAIIVHQNDFYDAVQTYSGLIKPLLPEFKKPPDLAYQPELCTWGYFRHIDPEHILGRLDRLKDLGIRSVIIDDGWSVYHGDWNPDPKIFPNGEKDFKGFINKIRMAIRS